MDIAINLEALRDEGYTEEEQGILGLFKATLAYAAIAELKANKLVQDILYIAEATAEDGGDLKDLWGVYLDVASLTPPDHPWQDALVGCVTSLSQRDDIAPGYPPEDDMSLWKNLPELSLVIREKWNMGKANFCFTHLRMYTWLTLHWMKAHDDTDSSERWKRFTSFVARFLANHFIFWYNYPIWQLRDALERPRHPDTSDTARACRLWAASEWLIRCAEPIYRAMHSDDELTDADRRAITLGPLCGQDVQVLGSARWEFWKKQLRLSLEEKLGDEALVAHITRAVSSMESAEKQDKYKTP